MGWGSRYKGSCGEQCGGLLHVSGGGWWICLITEGGGSICGVMCVCGGASRLVLPGTGGQR